MKIGREDFEALIKGEKDITPYIELNTLEGTYSVFGVKTASNPNYLLKAIYDMYESHLNKNWQSRRYASSSGPWGWGPWASITC